MDDGLMGGASSSALTAMCVCALPVWQTCQTTRIRGEARPVAYVLASDMTFLKQIACYVILRVWWGFLAMLKVLES